MENKYQWLIDESCQFRSKENVDEVLNNMNRVLDTIIYQDDSYSYEAYRALLIINHNFKSFLNPNYLGKPGNLSYLSYQIKMYYAYGGNQDIISYLVDIDSYHDKLLEVELQGKQQFVLRSFSIPFFGIPDDLKKLCECPDFYSDTTSENILKKIGLGLFFFLYI